VLRAQLTGIKVFKVGDEAEKQAFVVGKTTFGTVAARLSNYRLAYRHLVNPAIAALEHHTKPDARALRVVDLIRSSYRRLRPGHG
jgi:hypothetical protein